MAFEFHFQLLGRSFPVTPWVLFGLLGQGLFFMRFFVQWISSERRGVSHIPLAFWFFSLGGGVMLFTYAWQRSDLPIVLGQAAGILIYLRNLQLILRQRRAEGASA